MEEVVAKHDRGRAETRASNKKPRSKSKQKDTEEQGTNDKTDQASGGEPKREPNKHGPKCDPAHADWFTTEGKCGPHCWTKEHVSTKPPAKGLPRDSHVEEVVTVDNGDGTGRVTIRISYPVKMLALSLLLLPLAFASNSTTRYAHNDPDNANVGVLKRLYNVTHMRAQSRVWPGVLNPLSDSRNPVELPPCDQPLGMSDSEIVHCAPWTNRPAWRPPPKEMNCTALVPCTSTTNISTAEGTLVENQRWTFICPYDKLWSEVTNVHGVVSNTKRLMLSGADTAGSYEFGQGRAPATNITMPMNEVCAGPIMHVAVWQNGNWWPVESTTARIAWCAPGTPRRRRARICVNNGWVWRVGAHYGPICHRCTAVGPDQGSGLPQCPAICGGQLGGTAADGGWPWRKLVLAVALGLLSWSLPIRLGYGHNRPRKQALNLLTVVLLLGCCVDVAMPARHDQQHPTTALQQQQSQTTESTDGLQLLRLLVKRSLLCSPVAVFCNTFGAGAGCFTGCMLSLGIQAVEGACMATAPLLDPMWVCEDPPDPDVWIKCCHGCEHTQPNGTRCQDHLGGWRDGCFCLDNNAAYCHCPANCDRPHAVYQLTWAVNCTENDTALDWWGPDFYSTTGDCLANPPWDATRQPVMGFGHPVTCTCGGTRRACDHPRGAHPLHCGPKECHMAVPVAQKTQGRRRTPQCAVEDYYTGRDACLVHVQPPCMLGTQLCVSSPCLVEGTCTLYHKWTPTIMQTGWGTAYTGVGSLWDALQWFGPVPMIMLVGGILALILLVRR